MQGGPRTTIRRGRFNSRLLFIVLDYAFPSCEIPLVGRIYMAKDAPGMRGLRSRNDDGQLRDKRDDTRMGTIEKQYGRDFGVRSDKQLGNYLRENGVKSLNDLIQSNRGKKK